MTLKVPSEVLILIVDDDEDSAWSLGVYLESCRASEPPWRPTAFWPCGPPAKTAPTFILLDLEMPEMGGVAFRKAQVQNSALADIPVICILPELLDAQERARAAGITSIFLEPVPLVPLLSEVQRLVGVEPAVNPA